MIRKIINFWRTAYEVGGWHFVLAFSIWFGTLIYFTTTVLCLFFMQ